jgi:hypothetical protein
MRVGDLVNNVKQNRLYCGSGMYHWAVVMQLEPLILVSEGTDMRWDCVKAEEVPEVFGRASRLTTFRCLRRLSTKEKVDWFKSHLRSFYGPQVP